MVGRSKIHVLGGFGLFSAGFLAVSLREFPFRLETGTRDNLEDQTNNLVASAPGAARPGVKITSSNLLCVSIHRDVRQFWEDIITSVQLKTDFRKWICSSSFTKQKF